MTMSKRTILVAAMCAFGACAALYELFAARQIPAVPASARNNTVPPKVGDEDRPSFAAQRTSQPKSPRQLAEEAPLPPSLADFPQTEDVRRGWQSVRRHDIFGFGEHFTLTYLDILADLQRCIQGRVSSRGRLNVVAEWTLRQTNSQWSGTIRSIAPENSDLSEADDAVVLGCLERNVGLEIPLEDNRSGEDTLTTHWRLALPLRESLIYRRILSGGAEMTPVTTVPEITSSTSPTIERRR